MSSAKRTTGNAMEKKAARQFMDIAVQEAKEGVERAEGGPFGAVIVNKDGQGCRVAQREDRDFLLQNHRDSTRENEGERGGGEKGEDMRGGKVMRKRE
eukprot:1391777-Amorphochlora_amoeboformis.AAC.2